MICNNYTDLKEYNEINGFLLNAKYRSSIFIPLKFDSAKRRESKIKKNYFVDTTIDPENINENIKWIFNRETGICKCYYLEVEKWLKLLFDRTMPNEFEVRKGNDNQKYSFIFDSVSYFEFNTGVSFLCIGIIYEDIQALYKLCNLGDSKYNSFFTVSKGENECEIDFFNALNLFFEKIDVKNFFKTDDNYEENFCPLSDIFVSSIAQIDCSLRNTNTIRQASFNLHSMVNLFPAYMDDSESDIRYVYAAKDPEEEGTYGWGYCVSSQTLSLIVTGNNECTLKEISEKDFPIILMALYEKYTCLLFMQKIVKCYKKGIGNRKRINKLKLRMLEFQVYGVVLPANLCKWNNIRELYGNLLEVNGVPGAIEEINNKVQLLFSYQENRSAKRIDRISFIIAVMGIVSICDSVKNIITSIHSQEYSLSYLYIVISVFILSVICVLILHRK